MIGWSSTRDYVKIVDGDMLVDCPVTRMNIAAAEDILGPNLGPLKEKTVRHKRTKSLVADVPYTIIKTHCDITLCFDIMFVNKIKFLITVSGNTRFRTTKRLDSRCVEVVSATLLNVIKLYCKRGFRVDKCQGDGEFEALRGELTKTQTQLNITSKDKHVPEVEQYICTIKERARCTYNSVPFKKIPGIMIVELIHAYNFWLNMFPANDGVLSTHSPWRIMTGQQVNYWRHCQLQYGEDVQVHQSHNNSMTT